MKQVVASLLMLLSALPACGGTARTRASWAHLTIESGYAGEFIERVDDRSNKPELRYRATLECGDVEQGTGFLTDPQQAKAACSVVDERSDLLLNGDFLNRNYLCLLTFSSEVAYVTGTVKGVAIKQRFDRSDGCAMGDWDSVRFLIWPRRLTPE